MDDRLGQKDWAWFRGREDGGRKASRLVATASRRGRELQGRLPYMKIRVIVQVAV
jgi:hypothetical protein